MRNPTRRDLLMSRAPRLMCLPLAFAAVSAVAGVKDKGRAFHLYFTLRQKSQVGFEVVFTADKNTREMAVQLQQFTELSTGTGWRPMNMIVKYAGDVRHRSAYWLHANQYRLAVGLTTGYVYSIKVFARPLNDRNHVAGPTAVVASSRGRS